MGKKKPTIDVNLYHMSIHLGLCHGPIEALKAIYVGEKEAFSGTVTSETDILVDKQELFGGVRKEGGVSGSAYFSPGSETHVMPEGLARRLGRTAATCPGFRNVCSLFFTDGIDNSGGFYWTANQPTLRGVWATVCRRPKTLGLNFSEIGPDANPAHIIYECLTDKDWGMGAEPTSIDVPGFQAVAETLFNEGFGLSMIWANATDIESFITEILDHIQATLFLNPKNGLLTLKLIRPDYDINTLEVLNPDNCTVMSFQRKAWGETVNEIVVSWTNPQNEQEETVALQDLANVAIQNSIVSESRNYYGVRNANLAQQLCVRDLRSSSAPLASVEIEVNRVGWDLIPGEVVRLNYPEYSIENLVVRITNIDYGRPGSPYINITAVEDIFALPFSSFTAPPTTEWVDTSTEPSPMDFVRVVTLPYYMVAQVLNESELQAVQSPEVVAAVLAADSNQDTYAFELLGEDNDPSGGTSFISVGERNLAGRSLLPVTLTRESQSIISDFGSVFGQQGPEVSGFAMFGSNDESEAEICLITGFNSGDWTVQRGMLDTVPRNWPAGTEVWFFKNDSNFVDNSTLYAFETVDYKLLSRTSLGALDESLAPTVSYTLTERPYLPLRPANCQVEGEGFGVSNVSLSTDINVTWENRNSQTEDNVIVNWDGGDNTPENGQTTTIEVLDNSASLIVSYTGLTGSSHVIPFADLNGETELTVVFYSERGGDRSLQEYEIEVLVS
jgi:hypothetical protein